MCTALCPLAFSQINNKICPCVRTILSNVTKSHLASGKQTKTSCNIKFPMRNVKYIKRENRGGESQKKKNKTRRKCAAVVHPLPSRGVRRGCNTGGRYRNLKRFPHTFTTGHMHTRMYTSRIPTQTHIK